MTGLQELFMNYDRKILKNADYAKETYRLIQDTKVL